MLGAGTQENPFIIQTPADLNAIRNNLSAYYELANDIDLSSWGNWTPIAPDSTNMFTGTIDGKGHKILNLTINNNTKDQQSFIVWTTGATFKNIAFENAYVKTRNYSSIFVARPTATVFENCYIKGTIQGSLYNAAFSYSTSSATFKNCFVDVTVTSAYGGALVAVDSMWSVFDKCYSNANVAFIYKPNTNASYKTQFQNSYFNKNRFNGTNQSGLTGLTDSQMKQQSSFVGWDFDTVWYMKDYPALRIFDNIPVAKKQTINIQSYTNPCYSKISKTNKAIKQTQSFLNSIQTLSQRHTATKRIISTFTLPIETSVQKSNRTVRRGIENVNTYISPVASIVERKTKTFKHLLSYVDNIKTNVNVIAPVKNKSVNAYVSIIENPSSVQIEENLSNAYIIENPSFLEVIK